MYRKSPFDNDFFFTKRGSIAQWMVLFIPEEAFESEAYLQGPSPPLKIATQSAVFLVSF